MAVIDILSAAQEEELDLIAQMEEVKERDSRENIFEKNRGADRQNFRDISEAMPEIRDKFNQSNNNDELTGSTAANTMSSRAEYKSMPVI